MTEMPTREELQSRIQRDLDHYGGNMPERVALVWSGYLAALIEWGLISPFDHGELWAMLPRVENNPAVAILLGRTGTE